MPASNPAGSVIVALAQFYPRLGDVAGQPGRSPHRSITEAAAQGAGLVVFPELSLTGYFLKDQVPGGRRARSNRRRSHALRDASRTAGSTSSPGLILESDAHRFYNACVYISGGDVVHVHRKVYLPTYGLFDEQRYVAAGDRFRAFDVALGGRTGPSLARGHPHLRGPVASDRSRAARAPGRGSAHLPVGVARRAACCRAKASARRAATT